MKPDTLPDLRRILLRERRAIAIAAISDAVLPVLVGGLIFSIGLKLYPAYFWWLLLLPALTAAMAVVIVLQRWLPLTVIASRLDRHFALHDLLTTAWTSREEASDPWNQIIRADANARAAELPRLETTQRIPRRLHVAVVLVWLAIAIIPMTPQNGALAGLKSVESASLNRSSDDHQIVASAAQPTDQTAGSSNRNPRQISAVGNALPTPKTTGENAAGRGRADVENFAAQNSKVNASHGTEQSQSSEPMQISAGGNGLQSDAKLAGVGELSSGTVLARTSNKSRDEHADATINTPVDVGQQSAAAAANVPGAYRDLVRDYFAH